MISDQSGTRLSFEEKSPTESLDDLRHLRRIAWMDSRNEMPCREDPFRSSCGWSSLGSIGSSDFSSSSTPIFDFSESLLWRPSPAKEKSV
jgi:hypothetical protein